MRRIFDLWAARGRLRPYPPGMTWYPRNVEALLGELVETFPITVIQGARQVGKSSLADRVLAGRGKVVTFDDVETRNAADADIKAFVDQYPSGTLVIDEIQHCPDVINAVKASVDRDRRPGRFVLTGSANLLRLSGDADSLAGRAVTLQLRGLSQGELRSCRDDFVAWLLSASAADMQAFGTVATRGDYARLLSQGGYPEVQRLSPRVAPRWLDSYQERVIGRDSANIPGGASRERLAKVARLIAANQGGELVKVRIAEQAEVAQSTVTAYLDVLEAVYLLGRLPAWSPNLTKREVARPKVFIADSALALRLARISSTELLPLGNRVIGGFIEAFVAEELSKQQGWSEVEFSLHHYRDRSGLEVDLILELSDGRVIGIEVKASTTHKADHFAGLIQLRDRLGDRFLHGVVLGMAEKGFQYAERIHALPISALWETAASGPAAVH